METISDYIPTEKIKFFIWDLSEQRLGGQVGLCVIARIVVQSLPIDSNIFYQRLQLQPQVCSRWRLRLSVRYLLWSTEESKKYLWRVEGDSELT